MVSLLDSIANTTNVSAATDRAKDIATKLNAIDVATVNETQRAELTKLREDIIDSLLSVIGNQTGEAAKKHHFPTLWHHRMRRKQPKPLTLCQRSSMSPVKTVGNARQGFYVSPK